MQFDTTTKVKLKTKYGTILKVTHYSPEFESYNEYKINPKCKICGDNIGCMCFDWNNSDEPYETAVDHLESTWICNKQRCVFKSAKDDDPEHFDDMYDVFKGDERKLLHHLQFRDGNVGDSNFCSL